MSQRSDSRELVYVDLDTPRRWWASILGLVAGAMIVAVLVAPWMINWDDGEPNTAANNAMQTTSSVCRPDNSGIPSLLNPTVASWSRFCEWFVEPGIDNP